MCLNMGRYTEKFKNTKIELYKSGKSLAEQVKNLIICV